MSYRCMTENFKFINEIHMSSHWRIKTVNSCKVWAGDMCRFSIWTGGPFKPLENVIETAEKKLDPVTPFANFMHLQLVSSLQ